MSKKPTPKKKLARSQGRKRHGAFLRRARRVTAGMTTLVPCPKCKASMRAHHACPFCGFYRGKDVLKKSSPVETKAKKVTRAKA